MKKFKHTNEELARAKANTVREYQTGMINNDLKRVVQKPKFISKGEEQ